MYSKSYSELKKVKIKYKQERCPETPLTPAPRSGIQLAGSVMLVANRTHHESFQNRPIVLVGPVNMLNHNLD